MGGISGYMLFLSMCILGLNTTHGIRFNPRSYNRKIEIVESKLNTIESKFNTVESKLNTIIKELDFVKEDLKEEREKSFELQDRLNALMGDDNGTVFENEDQMKKVDTVPKHPQQRVYNALYDEKQQRKRFESRMKNDTEHQREHMEMKITSFNESLSTHIDNTLSSLKDEVLQSVTLLNDSITFIKDLARNVKLNDKTINNLKFESEQQNTTLFRHDTMLDSLNDSLEDVQSSIVELNDTCHYQGWSDWSNWSTCSKSCGVSQKTSTRTCNSTNTPLSGKCCIGSDVKTQICTLRSCPDPKDCLDFVHQNRNNLNGVYNVTSPSSGLVYPVYCDMTTEGGGWTVFQKRFDGSLDFYRTFKEYEDGFGDVKAEFWMGLKHIHDMTFHHNTELRIDLTAADGTTGYVTFQNFSLSPGPDYTLHIIGKAAGSFDDDSYGLPYNNGARFSTKDKDVDNVGSYDCAEKYHGGWWYHDCTYVNLNGDYVTPGTQSSYGYNGDGGGGGGVVYYGFQNNFQSLKTTAMMFRRK